MYRGRLTKVDMARVIIFTLYNMSSLPRPTDGRVVEVAKRKVEYVTRSYEMAKRALESIGRSVPSFQE